MLAPYGRRDSVGLVTVTAVDTPHGVARVHETAPHGPARATLVLGHGAGGSVSAPDLQAVAAAALEANLSVQDELDAVSVPLLVVQGASDRFGQPQPAPGREVVSVPGDHGLKRDLDVVSAAVVEWIERTVLGS